MSTRKEIVKVLQTLKMLMASRITFLIFTETDFNFSFTTLASCKELFVMNNR
jgi:hypothetical protein